MVDLFALCLVVGDQVCFRHLDEAHQKPGNRGDDTHVANGPDGAKDGGPGFVLDDLNGERDADDPHDRAGGFSQRRDEGVVPGIIGVLELRLYATEHALQDENQHQGQQDDDKHLQHPGLQSHGLHQVANGFREFHDYLVAGVRVDCDDTMR